MKDSCERTEEEASLSQNSKGQNYWWIVNISMVWIQKVLKQLAGAAKCLEPEQRCRVVALVWTIMMGPNAIFLVYFFTDYVE